MHNFSCIQNDFIEIKKKQKFHEILLISIVGLLSMILLILVFNLPSDDTPSVNSTPVPKTEKKPTFSSKKADDKTKPKNK